MGLKTGERASALLRHQPEDHGWVRVCPVGNLVRIEEFDRGSFRRIAAAILDRRPYGGDKFLLRDFDKGVRAEDDISPALREDVRYRLVEYNRAASLLSLQDFIAEFCGCEIGRLRLKQGKAVWKIGGRGRAARPFDAAIFAPIGYGYLKGHGGGPQWQPCKATFGKQQTLHELDKLRTVESLDEFWSGFEYHTLITSRNGHWRNASTHVTHWIG